MARHYDKLIRFYDSWFADLEDERKGFTPAECWQVMKAIRDCQREGTTEPLENLPATIARGLSMATLIEQVEIILEKMSGASARGKKGSQAQKIVLTAEQAAAAEEKKKQEEAKKIYEQHMAAFYEMVKTKFGMGGYELYVYDGDREDLLRRIYAEDHAANQLSFEKWKIYRRLTDEPAKKNSMIKAAAKEKNKN